MSTYQYWQAKFEHPDEAEEELKSVIKGLFEYFEGDYGVRRLSAQVREMGLKCTKYSKRRRFMSNRKYQRWSATLLICAIIFKH